MFWKKEKREPVTHDYTHRGWGHDYIVREVFDGGHVIQVTGFGFGLKPRDYILMQNEGKTTRYQIDTINYYADPDDMWNATMFFAPREVE